MADLNLAVVARASVDKLTGPLQAAKRQAGALGRTAEEMERQLAQVDGQKAQVDAFKRSRAQVAKTQAAWKEAQEEVARLGREMKATAEPTKAQVKAFEAAKRQAGRLKEAHREGGVELERLRRGLHGAGVSTRRLAEEDRRLRRESGRLTEAMEAQQKRLARFDEMSKSANKGMLIGAGVAAAGMGVSAVGRRMQGSIQQLVQPLAELDQVQARLRSMPGVSGEVAAQIIASGREWSRHHSDTAAEYGAATYEMISAGLDHEAAMAATEAALATAKATGGDAAGTAKLLGIAYNNLADKTKPAREELARMGDVLTATQQTFQISDLGELSRGIENATGAAVTGRVSFNQMAAALGAMSTGGQGGERGGTAFTALVGRMADASEQIGFGIARTEDGGMDLLGTVDNLQQEFGDLGSLTDEQAGKLRKAFGEEGLRGIVALAGNLDQAKEAYAGYADDAGAAAKAQAEVEKGAQEQAKIVENNINDAKIAFAKGLLPVLTDMIPEVTKLLQKFTGFAEAHPELTKTAGKMLLVGAATARTVGPLLQVAGAFTTAYHGGRKLTAWAKKAEVIGKIGRLGRSAAKGVRAMNLAMVTSPVGILTMALLGLAAAITAVVMNWDEWTGQTNTYGKFDKATLDRVRQDKKHKKRIMDAALEGHNASRELLKAAFQDEPLEQIFREADQKRKQEKLERLREEAGLESGGPAAGGAAAGNMTQQLVQNNNLNITQQPGEDSEAFARRVVEMIEEKTQREQRGALYDSQAVAG